MPSLIRFIVFCAVLAGIVYGAMFALAIFVEPNPRELTVRIPNDKLDLQQ
ncbi:MAG: histidine kinase [Nitratireductor sp.]